MTPLRRRKILETTTPMKVLEKEQQDLAARVEAREKERCENAAILEEYNAQLEHFAMPQEARERLAPLLRRWGRTRAAQVLGLWTFLGDGSCRQVSTASLQVWGPPGLGKTSLLTDYLETLSIRNVRLNCAAFTTMGELNARLIELLRRRTVEAAGAEASKLPPSLSRSAPLGQQVRSIDKLEAQSHPLLQSLSQYDGSDGASGPVKVVVVLDHMQELPRLHPGAIELLLNLPEVLRWGSHLTIVFVGRLRLASLGLLPLREPPAVAFQEYTEKEAKEVLHQTLVREFPEIASGPGLESSNSATTRATTIMDVCGGVMQFAWSHLGRNLQQLLSVARQLLQEGLLEGSSGGCLGLAFQQRVLRAVQERSGVCDFSSLLGDDGIGMDAGSVSALVSMRQMTKAEKRLILAAYLAGYVEKEDDVQLFMPGMKRKARKKMASKQQQPAKALPVFALAPRPTSLSRLLAVYHKLARQPHLLGPPLFEHLAGLREAGLLRFPVERSCLDPDVKVTCRAELPLVRAIASELNISMAEYLIQH